MTWLIRLAATAPNPAGALASRGILAIPPLLPARQADFEALWFFSIMGLALVTLVSVAAGFAFGSVRPLWRTGQREVALLVSGAVGFVCILILALVLIALVGLTNHPLTPGTAPATIGAVLPGAVASP